MFERAELQELRQRANEMAEYTPNAGWKQAYLNLAFACDVLDAFIGRSTGGEVEHFNPQEQPCAEGRETEEGGKYAEAPARPTAP